MRLLSAFPILLLPCLLVAQNWEAGGSAGYGLPHELNAVRADIRGKTGFSPGFAFGGVLGNEGGRQIGGEIRYTYRINDLKVTSGDVKARAGAESHALHYDVLLNVASKDATVRPFFAAGAGVRHFRGTDPESFSQPLRGLIRLTNATQTEPLISFGAGTKFRVSDHGVLRFDFRDYATPFPNKLLAPASGVRVKGWMHDIVFLLGISAVF